MNRSKLTVAAAMSPFTRTIAADEILSNASRLMRELDIRHLPVLEGGRLCGVVSERDLLLLETLVGYDARHTTVSDAMSIGVYTAAPDTPLDVVLRTMALQKYGCVVVVDRAQVVGILTTVDVCRLFADHLIAEAS